MPLQQQAFGVGVIGCGRVAVERHLPVLCALSGVRVIALADVDARRLAETARRFRVEHTCADYGALLGRDDVDAVAILAPPQFHAEIGVAALDAGKHLFIEKPLALGLDDCRRLIAKAEHSSRHAMVGFNMRWHRLVIRAREIIASGVLGQIKAVSSMYTHPLREREERDWMRRRELGGGATQSEAGHHFDLWRFLLQSQVVEVFASSQSSERYDDETTAVTARMSDGTRVSGLFSLRTSGSNRIDIFGDRGRLSLSLYRFDGMEYLSYSDYEGSIARRARGIARKLTEIPQIIPALGHGGDFVATFRYEWRHFLDCLRSDSAPSCSLRDGLRAAEIALAACESAYSGRIVQLGIG